MPWEPRGPVRSRHPPAPRCKRPAGADSRAPFRQRPAAVRSIPVRRKSLPALGPDAPQGAAAGQPATWLPQAHKLPAPALAALRWRHSPPRRWRHFPKRPPASVAAAVRPAKAAAEPRARAAAVPAADPGPVRQPRQPGRREAPIFRSACPRAPDRSCQIRPAAAGQAKSRPDRSFAPAAAITKQRPGWRSRAAADSLREA